MKRHIYLKHGYLPEKEKYEWSNILSTISDISSIFCKDFSENLSGTPKFELLSAHFLKWQFSLHCTVEHDCNIESENLQYHLPDDLTHDAVFTSTVVQDLIRQIELNETKNLRLKSNSCSCQAKSKRFISGSIQQKSTIKTFLFIMENHATEQAKLMPCQDLVSNRIFVKLL